MDKQEKFEDKFDKKINEQNTLISDILILLKDHEPEKIKGQDKPKKDNDFYQVNINWLLLFLHYLYSLVINYLFYRKWSESLLMKYFMSISK